MRWAGVAKRTAYSARGEAAFNTSAGSANEYGSALTMLATLAGPRRTNGVPLSRGTGTGVSSAAPWRTIDQDPPAGSAGAPQAAAANCWGPPPTVRSTA